MQIWNEVNKKVDNYLEKFCIYADINFQLWEDNFYTIKDAPEEDIFLEIILDIAIFINEIVYKNTYMLDYVNKNKIYIVNKDKTISNLVAWKPKDKNLTCLRYGIDGKVRYILLKINIDNFFSLSQI